MITGLILGVTALGAALGVGKSVKAGLDQKDANSTNVTAQNIIERATASMDASRKASGDALNELGQQKLSVLDQNMSAFVASFEKLHNINLTDSTGLDELKKFRIDKQSVKELKEMNSMASSLLGGAASGAALGAITAFGAYGGAMTFGSASTGTAIGLLHGVASTNATLAFLGGGAISAGGLGIAGGTMVLGGLVAGPALAVMGFVLGAKASANKDAAYSNLSKAQEYREEMELARTSCTGIRMRATMFERLLIKLNVIFEPLIYEMNNIINQSGTDYAQYSPEQKNTIGAALAVAGAIKAVLDTPILTEDGDLTIESGRVLDATSEVISIYG